MFEINVPILSAPDNWRKEDFRTCVPVQIKQTPAGTWTDVHDGALKRNCGRETVSRGEINDAHFFIWKEIWETVQLGGNANRYKHTSIDKRFKNLLWECDSSELCSTGTFPRCRVNSGGNQILWVLNIIVTSLYEQ